MLATEKIDEIKHIHIDNCSLEMQRVHRVFDNVWIGKVEHLVLNQTQFDRYPKMTPQFCRSLCQFIETSVTTSFSLHKFKVYSSQLNAILKASRQLVNITIAKVEVLDREPLRMQPYVMYNQTRAPQKLGGVTVSFHIPYSKTFQTH